jgi:hypothetical protein
MELDREPHECWPHQLESNVWTRSIDTEKQLERSKAGKHDACEGCDCILHISAVGNDQSAGGAFFTSVLNQLIYAEQQHLKPWVHLDRMHPR